jgi:hypothetical protein
MKSKSTQAWGWLTAGVVALGLNGIYHDGGATWVHQAVDRVISRVEERTMPVLALASGRVECFMARTKLAAATHQTASAPLAATIARLQTKIAGAENGYARLQSVSAREEARFARQEAQMARLEANRSRIEAMASVRIPDIKVDLKIPHVCPRVHVNVPRVKIVRCSW